MYPFSRTAGICYVYVCVKLELSASGFDNTSSLYYVLSYEASQINISPLLNVMWFLCYSNVGHSLTSLMFYDRVLDTSTCKWVVMSYLYIYQVWSRPTEMHYLHWNLFCKVRVLGTIREHLSKTRFFIFLFTQLTSPQINEYYLPELNLVVGTLQCFHTANIAVRILILVSANAITLKLKAFISLNNVHDFLSQQFNMLFCRYDPIETYNHFKQLVNSCFLMTGSVNSFVELTSVSKRYSVQCT